MARMLPAALCIDEIFIMKKTQHGLRSKCPGGQGWEVELGYRGLLDALNAKSVGEGCAGTIGLQQRTQKDKAVFVTAGIHFSWEGTMCSTSVPYSTIIYCAIPPLKTPFNIQSTLLTVRALWFLSGKRICKPFFLTTLCIFDTFQRQGLLQKVWPRSTLFYSCR